MARRDRAGATSKEPEAGGTAARRAGARRRRRRRRLPDPRTLLGLSRLGLRAGVRALPMVSMLLPEGQQVLGPHLEFFDQHVPDGWPVDLLVCAVRRPDCRRALHHEREVLERHGIPTVVIEPGRDVLAHVSNDFMDPSQVVDIVRESFMDTGAQIAKHPILRSLEPTRRVSVDEVGGRSAS